MIENLESFSVKAVQKLSGINPNTLKAWERRYSAITPSRQKNGRRSYSRDDLVRIKLLNQLIRQGHSIASIARKSSDELRSLLSVLGEVSSIGFDSKTVAGIEEEGSFTELFIERMKSFDVDRITILLSGLRLRMSAKDFVLGHVVPLMTVVGDAVSKEKLTVAHEHMLSSIVKSELMNIFYTLSRSLRDLRGNVVSPSIAVCGVEGDIHEFGILCASILAACHGARPVYLGPNLPVGALIDAVKSMDVRAVLIGSTQLDPGTLRISVDNYIRILDEGLPSRVQIWVGGWLDSPLPESYKNRVIYHIPTLQHFWQFISTKI